MNPNEELYKGNNAADYQPPTQNPQSTGTNLQQSTYGLQPTDAQSDITQQRIPNVDNLKVIVVQDGSSTTNAYLTPVETATQTWIGPFWGSVLLGLIIIIVWAVRILAKEEAPKLTEALEEAIEEPILGDESTPVEKIVSIKKKKTTQKSHPKKTTKKKSKKR